MKFRLNSAVQPYKNSPIGVIRLDHTISGSLYSGLFTPSPFAARASSIRSLINANVITPIRKPIPRPI
jgi:hypothetical protein